MRYYTECCCHSSSHTFHFALRTPLLIDCSDELRGKVSRARQFASVQLIAMAE